MEPARVAVVILNYNGRDYLDKFLPSVLAGARAGVEVIVADNASTDDSLHLLAARFPLVRIIRLDQNYGYAKGYNRALREVQSEYYVLLNSDVQVDQGWIEPIRDLMDKNPTIAACQPKILSYASPQLFEYAGGSGGWLDFLGYPFARGRIFDYCETDQGQYEDTQACFWASGAALFVRAEAFWQAGGLYEFFFAHQEEIDLCWRLQRLGFQIYCCPQSRVYHVGGGTLPKGNRRKVFLNFRNNLIMLAKNLPLGRACWTLPLRFFLDMVSASKSLFAGEAIYFRAVLEAHLAFCKWVLVGPRQQPRVKRAVYRHQGLTRRSIVWQHFVLGKQRFSQIVETKK